MDERDKFFIKPQGPQDCQDKLPLNTIVGLFKIKFEANPTLLPFHLVETMNDFLG